MENRVGVLLAFALGAIVGYKWPTIKKTITPFTSKVEKGVVKGFLTVKDGICGVSGHFRKVAKEVAAEAKA